MGTALITGASAGLGAEYARLFAADKHDLVLVARRRDRLEALARELQSAHGVKARVVTADLAAPDGASRVVDEVRRLGLEIEFLVNNAGFGTSGAFVELDVGRELEMIQVNVAALVTLTRAFLPGMVARRRGRILARCVAGLRRWCWRRHRPVGRLTHRLLPRRRRGAIAVLSVPASMDYPLVRQPQAQ